MRHGDELIRDIVTAAQIPSPRKRQAVARELRAHLEDSINAAREAGRSDDEIRQIVLADFGDPNQVARGFAWVYRRERAMLRMTVFLLSTLAVASFLLFVMFAMQAGLAFSLGAPVLTMIDSRHIAIEARDIFATVTVYLGLIAVEKLFHRRHFLKAIVVLTFAVSAAAAVCEMANVHARFLVFGFVTGVFLRTLQLCMKSSLVRTSVTLVCFAAIGFLLSRTYPSPSPYALWLECASWLGLGAGYQLMTGLAPRVDAALSNQLQRTKIAGEVT